LRKTHFLLETGYRFRLPRFDFTSSRQSRRRAPQIDEEEVG